MSQRYSLKISGSEELEKSMQELIKRYPDELNLAQKRVTKDWRKDVVSEFPSHYKSFKKWKCTNEYGRLGLITKSVISNKAPHWHLVEDGHVKVLWGRRTGGFVKGKHYTDPVNAKYEKEYPDIIESKVNEIIKRSGL